MYVYIYNIYSQFLYLVTIVPEYIKLFLHCTTEKNQLSTTFWKAEGNDSCLHWKVRLNLIIWKVHIIIPELTPTVCPLAWMVCHTCDTISTHHKIKQKAVSYHVPARKFLPQFLITPHFIYNPWGEKVNWQQINRKSQIGWLKYKECSKWILTKH